MPHSLRSGMPIPRWRYLEPGQSLFRAGPQPAQRVMLHKEYPAPEYLFPSRGVPNFFLIRRFEDRDTVFRKLLTH